MKKILAILLAVAMVFSFAACGEKKEQGSDNPAAPVNWTFGTGGEQGTYYAYGTVLAQYVSNKTNLNITAVSSGGSKANIEDIDAGDIQLGFSQSDTMDYAYRGVNGFDSKIDSFSVVCALYMEDVQIVTVDPTIKTPADLKGKEVSVGAVGSGTYFNAIDVLDVYGMTLDDIKPVYQSFGDSTESMKNNQIAAAFVVAGPPTTSITDLCTSKDNVSLVNIDKEHCDMLIKKCPFYAIDVIPADTYKGVGETTTVAVAAMVLADDKCSDDDVYNFISTIFENKAEVASQHGKGEALDINFAASVTAVPFHKGAAKYFAEKNVTVKTK